MSHRFQRRAAIETAPLHGETILFDPAANRFCLLNQTAAFLWERLQAPATAEDLCNEVCRHFAGVDKVTARRDVEAALGEMQALAVIEPVT